MKSRAVLVLAVVSTLVVAALAAAQAKSGPGSVPSSQKEVIFYGFGGTHEKNMRTRILPAFEQRYGVKVVYVTGTANSNFAKVRAQKDRPEGDVLWTNDVLHVVGKRLGLFEKIDAQRLTNAKDVLDIAKDAAGFPVDFVYPKEGTILFGNWFEVLKGAPHPELAQELVNYLVSAEAQEAFAKHVFFGPINRLTKLDPETGKRVRTRGSSSPSS